MHFKFYKHVLSFVGESDKNNSICGKFIVLAITKCQININHNYLRGVLIEDFVHIGNLWRYGIDYRRT